MSTGPSEFGALAVTASSALGVAADSSSLGGRVEQAALNLRVERGPLAPHESQSILAQYNSLAMADVRAQDFLRWIQDGPEGPAWHAILETDSGEIVGHTSLIPLRAVYEGRSLVGAKSEYSFIREEFRASKIRGFENSGRLKNLIYIDELFRRCRKEGWSPLLISTPSGFHRVFRSIACYPVEFPLWECLLVLRPRESGRATPNLRGWQRLLLGGIGLAQTAVWTPAASFSPRSRDFRTELAHVSPFRQTDQALSFFPDKASLAWRYPEAQYARIAAEAKNCGNLMVKRGSKGAYLRVCQWNLDSAPPPVALIAALVRQARQHGALGVRWAVYGDNPACAAIVWRLRSLGFLCARRVRTLLINTTDERFLNARTWNLTDAMFSFDH